MGMYQDYIAEGVKLAKSRVLATVDAVQRMNPQREPRRNDFDVAKLLDDGIQQYPPELWIGPRGEQVFGSAFIIYLNTPAVKNGKKLLDRGQSIAEKEAPLL